MTVVDESLLKKASDLLNKQPIVLNIYAVLKDSFEIKRLNLTKAAQEQLLVTYKDSILDNLRYEENEIPILNLSQADNRRHIIYQYDEEDFPGSLNSLKELSQLEAGDIKQLETEDFIKIEAILIDIGDNQDQLTLYKNISSVELIRPDTKWFGLKDGDTLSVNTDPSIRLTPKFDMMFVNGKLYVFNLKFIERHEAYNKLMLDKARTECIALEHLSYVESIDSIKLRLDSEDMPFARKLIKVIRNSPVINKNIPNIEIQHFCQNHPVLKKLKFNNTKILLNTKISHDLFLKLLQDDYLYSLLTGENYEGIAKNIIIEGVTAA